jgi:DNA-binding NarL/FixJ family response regulator
MISVVVADDETLVRGGLRMIIDAQPDMSVVGEAGDGREVLDVVRAVRPDVVLMDIRMPGLDGIEATRHVRAMPSPTPNVIVLTTFDLDQHVYDAIRAGASGFLLKSTAPDQLVAGVRAVVAGDALLAPEITRRLLDRFTQRPPPGTRQPTQLEALTHRELDVLRLIARGHSNAEVAAALVVTEATVKTHVNHILTKLRLRDRVQAVALAYQSGLMDDDTLD